jgi:hypothetical protein
MQSTFTSPIASAAKLPKALRQAARTYAPNTAFFRASVVVCAAAAGRASAPVRIGVLRVVATQCSGMGVQWHQDRGMRRARLRQRTSPILRRTVA